MRQLVALLSLSLLAACPSSPGGEPEPELSDAAGVRIDEIAVYQGVKRTLIADGEEVDSEVPLIAGRDALVRVFVSSDDGYDGEAVTGRLHLGDEVIEVEVDRVRDESRDHRLDSTVNFVVPGDLVQDPLEWSVELLQQGEGTNEDARFPADGTHETRVEGRANRLRLVIAPFSYEFDGSGRLPDLSEAQIARIRDLFLGLYPVSDVQIRVRDPEPWDGELRPDGTGWEWVGFQLFQMRGQDGETDDAYYYGIFNPADTLEEYCGFQCLLGVTLLNNDPPDTGSVNLRLALGVGFTESAPSTAVHEIGHSHGRQHAPCGPPSILEGIDPGYPNNTGDLDVWGWDIVHEELKAPDEMTDFMGYCDPQWVSEYTYTALHRRGTNVNANLSVEGTFSYDVLWWDGATLRWVQTLDKPGPVAGKAVEVTALTDGNPSPRGGVFVPWDHLPGGVLLVLRGELEADRYEVTLDGRFATAER